MSSFRNDTPGLLEDNLGAAGWSLSDEHMTRLNTVNVPELYPYAFI